jgi:hypothetical protein
MKNTEQGTAMIPILGTIEINTGKIVWNKKGKAYWKGVTAEQKKQKNTITARRALWKYPYEPQKKKHA